MARDWIFLGDWMMRFGTQLLFFAVFFAAFGLKSSWATETSKLPGSPWPEPSKKDADKIKKEIRKGLPKSDFKITQVGPWIIATDMEPRGMRRTVDLTIRVFGANIQKQLFTKKPRTKPVKVYLFKDFKSYQYYNEKLFGEAPGTPYGFYSRSENALVMNIGSGGGTLLHEMVHAMAESEYASIPAWLNEGLGSLYEASHRTREGFVTGVTNWRLKGLQEALKKGTVAPLRTLMKMSDTEFYNGKFSSSNYGVARYLMQWLQENGKLEFFYWNIRDKKKPGGAEALVHVMGGKKTLTAIENEYFAWAKALKRP